MQWLADENLILLNTILSWMYVAPSYVCGSPITLS